VKYKFSADNIYDIDVDSIIVFFAEYEKINDKFLKALDVLSNGVVTTLLESGEFTGAAGEWVVIYKPEQFKARRIILAGLGAKNKIDADTFRRVMGTASREKTLKNTKKLALYFSNFNNSDYYQAAIEGYLLGSYKMLDYKTGDRAKDTDKLTEITFVVDRKAGLNKLTKGVERGIIVAEGQLLVRTLGNIPGNDLPPRVFADRARALARQHKINCQVLDEKAIEKEKMGALLSVARGSIEKPRFVILNYKGRSDNQQPIVLVGKGVTFDAGGISLKPSLNMHEMKNDMSGAAVVLATLVTAARLNIARNIIGLFSLTENMMASKVTKPGDIIISRKGLTVEVINTDAEGRLILADALDYANKFKPQAVVDIATLTGAALYVLGYAGSPIMGNNSKLMDIFRKAADDTAEKVWEMPIWEEHRNIMKSSLADLVNSGGKNAGTIAAGAFLENFIGDWPWGHIDIAYTESEPKGRPYLPTGLTGYGLRLFVSMLTNWKKP